MASYTVTSPATAVHSKTLVASTADTITFDYHAPTIEVISLDGAAAIFIRVDGSAAAVNGTSAYVIPAAIGARTLRVKTGGNTTVSVISSGTPTYSVQQSNSTEAT